ncbi:DNA-binding CsgD family transcriptional regulator [Streptomyces sp. V3I8]|uniref:ATP-binding protein n=1 Tax=Streptomyces sp. V3I8 TaxID=3042279 RepID=UPI002780C696|nr:LuxR family transcriptional regulator [Streptomyces sp. V3I8]MDQ1041732.1 DNA-binding CsgD family transcriptional regulator [Streptomyces sp. V3I8]
MTLVGRDSVLHTLHDALERCVPGEAHTVLVEGAAGCGKSELLDTFAERASGQGALVLQAVGSAAERTLALGVMHQLASCASPGSLPVPAAAGSELSRTAAMHAFCAALRTLTARTPVVACVDDLHHVDDASLRFLAHILRHARSAAFLLVVAGPVHDSRRHRDFRTELLRRTNVTLTRLELFTLAQTGSALAGRGRTGRDAKLVGALHAHSGGNPLLLRALAEEYEWAAPQAAAAAAGGGPHRPFPAVDGLFVAAVDSCLRRSGAGAPQVAQALAVLDGEGSDQELGRLVELPAADVARALASITAAGIVEQRRFRHPVVAAALLDRMDPAERALLHRRAGEVLHAGGQPSGKVARHLVAAQHEGGRLPGAAWVSDVLREAAEQLVAADDIRQAAAVLELAHAGSADEQQRAEIKTRLASVTWRFNPSAAEQHLSAPLGMLREGGLGVERMEPLAAALATQGRVAEANEVGAHISAALGTEYGSRAESGERQLSDGPQDREAARSERILQSTVLQDSTLLALVRAIRTLVHCEQPERAATWCGQRLEEAARCNAPTWQATFATLHAEALLRLGDLPGAKEYALLALEFLPQRSGNAFAGSPTAHLIRAHTGMGRHAEAAAQLEQPVPDTLFRSVHGLAYLRARGLHWLATGQLRAALADFLEVGRLAREWGMDRPAVLAWRGDAAEALLQLGDQERAEKLIMQQLAGPDARRSWVRGTSLRLRAALQPPQARVPVLHQAVEELRKSGDRVELARALADLGQVLQELGDAAQAGVFSRQAWGLAENCGARPLRERILPGAVGERAPAGRAPRTPAAGESEYRLSESERRVATLAARGYTNRQISRELYITVSTVEQHLTRVYRKLSITRRQDLPADLQLAAREAASRESAPAAPGATPIPARRGVLGTPAHSGAAPIAAPARRP